MERRKPKTIDKVKLIKRTSREDNKITGKGGPHKNKNEKRQHKMTTQDYLDECEEEMEDEDCIKTDD